jgi:TPR repeat protein
MALTEAQFSFFKTALDTIFLGQDLSLWQEVLNLYSLAVDDPQVIELIEAQKSAADNALKSSNQKERANAFYRLAVHHHLFTKDYAKALDLYNRAIDLGHSGAINNLGFMYHRGQGIPRDFDKAIGLYRQAINLNNSTAMHNLATYSSSRWQRIRRGYA